MRVAVMQPYFYPYMGYFRLIAAVDLFVIFDCVQFPRRGRVHRAPLPGDGWLTLPLAYHPQDTAIADITLADDRDARWLGALSVLRWLSPGLRSRLQAPLPKQLLFFLETHIRSNCADLGITTPLVRSSDFRVDPALHGQDRVIALARATGATDYVNLPGGRALYDPAGFARAGLGLWFMPDYPGPHMSMLQALCTADPVTLRADLAAEPQAAR
jgi:hypothetical protein